MCWEEAALSTPYSDVEAWTAMLKVQLGWGVCVSGGLRACWNRSSRCNLLPRASA